MIETNGSKKVFTGGKTNTNEDTNTVATWDNRQQTRTVCSFTGTDKTLTSPSGPTELSSSSNNECYFMSWGDAATFLSQQMGYNSSAAGYEGTSIYLDGSQALAQFVAQGTNLEYELGSEAYAPTEGYHYTTIYGNCTAGTTGTWKIGYETWVVTVQ